MSANQHVLDNVLQCLKKAVRAGYEYHFALSGSLETFISRLYGCIWLWVFGHGVDKWKKITSLKLYVIRFKSSPLSEMVAEDYLVSFLHENSALVFCNLINKNKQNPAVFFLASRDYNISESRSKKCVGYIYRLHVGYLPLEKSRPVVLFSTVIHLQVKLKDGEGGRSGLVLHKWVRTDELNLFPHLRTFSMRHHWWVWVRTRKPGG